MTAPHEAAPQIRVGTRASGLALAQTGQIVDRLRERGCAVVVETITTRGDTRGDQPVAALGSDGVFVRELERALLEGRIDLAVHSLKDLPTAAVPGLSIACVPARATPFDALVGRPGDTLETLPAGAIVGTSSIRRAVQIEAVRPDLLVRPIRGNVDTRLRRLDAGDCACLILAAAGLERLGLGERITTLLEPPLFWPAVGQGALALQIRSADAATARAIAPLDDPATHRAVRAERSCLAELSGGCLAPVGGWARVDAEGALWLGARVLERAGQSVRHVGAEARQALVPKGSDLLQTADELGQQVAASLLAAGAAEMLARMRGNTLPP
jgi:hydroxymethylbilane synthase